MRSTLANKELVYKIHFVTKNSWIFHIVRCYSLILLTFQGMCFRDVSVRFKVWKKLNKKLVGFRNTLLVIHTVLVYWHAQTKLIEYLVQKPSFTIRTLDKYKRIDIVIISWWWLCVNFLKCVTIHLEWIIEMNDDARWMHSYWTQRKHIVFHQNSIEIVHLCLIFFSNRLNQW